LIKGVEMEQKNEKGKNKRENGLAQHPHLGVRQVICVISSADSESIYQRQTNETNKQS
jgi:hypothetical protein